MGSDRAGYRGRKPAGSRSYPDPKFVADFDSPMAARPKLVPADRPDTLTWG